MRPNNGIKSCAALLIGNDGKKFKPGSPCGAGASFTSRGHACCWVHYQADTRGPRAGKVEFLRLTKSG